MTRRCKRCWTRVRRIQLRSPFPEAPSAPIPAWYDASVAPVRIARLCGMFCLVLLLTLHTRYALAGTNRLIDSRDPYLLLHAHNPVDWYPWGSEAFAQAVRESKPIFISIGYSTCYWCHVAERTIYSNPEIAKLMNQWFVNIKIDREQLPDVDQIYMTATEIMTGHGGWPNNLFLTPDLKPFYAGSYFSAADFTKILSAIHQAWTNDRSHVVEAADQVYSALQQARFEQAAAKDDPIDPANWIAQAKKTLLPRLDPEYGGLASGDGPKFPQEPDLELMLADYRLNRDPRVRLWLVSTLDAMAYGGIRDLLGEGFHRYSTEPTWSIPHFEKMLYDNAQLLRIYAEAFHETSEPLYRQVAIGIGDYLGNRMMAGEGGFFTAEDSQIEGVEGASYVWTREQIESVLGKDDAAKFFQIYQLAPMPPPRGQAPAVANPGVIRVRLPISDALKSGHYKNASEMLAAMAPMRRQLLSARDRRPQPARDEKIVVSLNGLTIQALAGTAAILSQPKYLAWAKLAAERVWALAWDAKTQALKHEIFQGRAQTSGYLDDYALLGNGFVTIYEVSGERSYGTRAGILADAMLKRFSREDGSFVSSQGSDLLIPVEDSGDDVYPSGTSSAIELLLRLGALSKNPRYIAAAARAIRNLSGQFHLYPERWPVAVTAAATHPLNLETKLAGNQAQTGNSPTGVRTLNTSDHVHASAMIEPSPNRAKVRISLTVDDGYHINANPASLDYLVPTSVSFDHISPSAIDYPPPQSYAPSFSELPLKVYGGSVIITATFPSDSLSNIAAIRGTVMAQACDDHACLPPASLPVSAKLNQR
jgi:uncharacterized protein YyaL (SSP411 family)